METWKGAVVLAYNIQREGVLPSEKAFAYRMKFEAMKHRGSKGDMLTIDRIGEKNGESGKTVQRYIRLTELCPELLAMVDQQKLKVTPAVNLSYLPMEGQRIVLDIIARNGVYPDGRQSAKLKEYSQLGRLTREAAEELMSVRQTTQERKLILTGKKIEKYFGRDEYTKEEMEEIILALLENWFQSTGSV